jgi:hypothetical protein
MCSCSNNQIPLVFFLVVIPVYSIGYSTAYLVKSAPAYLIRLVKEVIKEIIDTLRRIVSYCFLAVDSVFTLLYLSNLYDLDGHLVGLNAPIMPIFWLLSSVAWWSYIISRQVDKYAQKYISTAFLYNKNTFHKVFFLCRFFIKKFFPEPQFSSFFGPTLSYNYLYISLSSIPSLLACKHRNDTL